MTNGYRLGRGSPAILGAAGLFAGLLAGFVWWEIRAPAPILDLSLFRRRVFSLGVLASFISFLGVASVRFIMPFYLQGALGYAPNRVGLTTLPTAITMTVIGPIAGRLSDRYGYRAFDVSGSILAPAGVFTISRVSETTPLAVTICAMVAQSAGTRLFGFPELRVHIRRGAGQPARSGVRASQPHAELRQRHLHSRGHRRGDGHHGADGPRARSRRCQRRGGPRAAALVRPRHEPPVSGDGLSAAGGGSHLVLRGARARRGRPTSATGIRPAGN